MLTTSKRMLLKTLSVAACTALGGYAGVRWFERANVYRPSPGNLRITPKALGLPFEEVWLSTSDSKRIHSWFFPVGLTERFSKKAVLFAHGNAGNMSHRFDVYRMLLHAGINVLAFDYRGYGLSEGRPTEDGTYLDADAAVAWLASRGYQPKDVVAFGESLGGGIASETALRNGLAGLILLSSFTSVPELGKELFPMLPVRWISTIKYDTRSKLRRLKCPTLMLHSHEDGLIDFHHAERNHEASVGNKELIVIQGDHNSAVQMDELNIRQSIERFLSTRVWP